MKQYCRYCCYLVVGDNAYCTKREQCIKESYAKAVNRCHDFALNPMDAFFENEKGYQPRVPKEPKKTQCDGQISLFEKGE